MKKKTFLIANVGESEIYYDISGYSPASIESFKRKIVINKGAKTFKIVKPEK